MSCLNFGQLSNVSQLKQNYIEVNIENDDKPKSRAKAVKALYDLQKGLSKRMNNEQMKAS